MDWDDVRNGLKKAVLSHWEVVGDLQDAKDYHGRRSGEPECDPDADKPKVRVPLLWGRF